MIKDNKFPDIDSYNSDNPTLISPNSLYEISFYQTPESTINVEDYKRFIENAIHRFRTSPFYKIYKSKLINLGLDRCQVLGNITVEMATIEMHHCILNIFDVTTIIANHLLATYGKITTFDLVEHLKINHAQMRVPLCMLALTPHQLYHNDDRFYVSPRSVIGNWWNLLETYNKGLTMDIAFKILFYLKRAINNGDVSEDGELLNVRDKIESWIKYNSINY